MFLLGFKSAQSAVAKELYRTTEAWFPYNSTKTLLCSVFVVINRNS